MKSKNLMEQQFRLATIINNNNYYYNKNNKIFTKKIPSEKMKYLRY